ncbi:hypothetical protein JW872_03925 [Candidatus Babeliales bacterium]|nr:hypothetical protein [Candidatus Babeliales bacterium]
MYKHYLGILLCFMSCAGLDAHSDITTQNQERYATENHGRSSYRLATLGTIVTGLGIAAAALWRKRENLLMVADESSAVTRGGRGEGTVAQVYPQAMSTGQPRRHPRLTTTITAKGGHQQGKTFTHAISERCPYCAVHFERGGMHWCECPQNAQWNQVRRMWVEGRTPQDMERYPHFICDDCFARGNRECGVCASYLLQ